MKHTLVFSLLLTVSVPAVAAAETADSFGVDSRASAMGGAGTALAAGGAGAYYNPGALGASGTKDLRIGFVGAHTIFPDSTGIVVGYDIDDRPIISDVNNQTDFIGGAVISWSVPIKKRFAFGGLTYMPIGRVLRIQTQDPFIPTYSLYDNRHQRLTLNLGFSARIAAGVRVGLGTSVLAANKLDQGFNVPAGEEDENRTSGHIGLDIVPRAAPTGGVYADLGKGLTAGVTYRGELLLPVDIRFFNGGDVIISTGPSLSFRQRTEVSGTIALVEHYTPAQVALGVAWDRVDSPFAVTADVTWLRWSAYRGPYIDATYDPMVIPPLGEVPVNWRSPPIDEFRDTFLPRLGAEWRTAPGRPMRLALRAGYAFEASPIPLQTGETNLLDSDKHVFTAGAGWTFPAPFGLTSAPMRLDLHTQVHQLIGRRVDKFVTYDCNDPSERPPVGTPCSGQIGVSGQILSGGANLSLSF